MRYRKKPINYFPIVRSYKSNLLKKRRLPLLSIKRLKNYKPKKNKLFNLLIGFLLISFGILSIIKNIVVYTPIFFGNSLGSGANFAASSILFLLGVLIVFFNRKNLLGYMFIGLGIITIFLSVFLSLRMRFLPTSLFNTIFIFSCIIAGFSLIIKWIIKNFIS